MHKQPLPSASWGGTFHSPPQANSVWGVLFTHLLNQIEGEGEWGLLDALEELVGICTYESRPY